MSASLSLLFRILLAWTVALIVAAIIWSEIFGSTGSIFALVAIFLLVVAVTSTLSHLRRVNLLAGRLDRDSLASRQRRQIARSRADHLAGKRTALLGVAVAVFNLLGERSALGT